MTKSSDGIELTQFSKHDRVAKMNIRARWIDPELDPKRAGEREFLTQLGFADDLGRALLQNCERLVSLHRPILV